MPMLVRMSKVWLNMMVYCAGSRRSCGRNGNASNSIEDEDAGQPDRQQS